MATKGGDLHSAMPLGDVAQSELLQPQAQQ